MIGIGVVILCLGLAPAAVIWALGKL